MIVSMVSEVRLVLNLKKAWFYIVCGARVYSPEDALLRKHSTSPNAGLMLVHRLRRCPNIKPRLGECIMFHGLVLLHISSWSTFCRALPAVDITASRFTCYTPPRGTVLWLICVLGNLCSLVIHVTVNWILESPQASTISRLNWFKQWVNLLHSPLSSEEIVILWNVTTSYINLRFQ